MTAPETDQRTINAAVYAMQEAGDRAGVELTYSDLEVMLQAALPYLLIAAADDARLVAAQAEVDRLRGAADAAMEDATVARTDGYVDALRWVIADLEANQACTAYEFIRDFRARLTAIENGVEKP